MLKAKKGWESLKFWESPVLGPGAAPLGSQVWTKHHLPPRSLLSQCYCLCLMSSKVRCRRHGGSPSQYNLGDLLSVAAS